MIAEDGIVEIAFHDTRDDLRSQRVDRHTAPLRFEPKPIEGAAVKPDLALGGGRSAGDAGSWCRSPGGFRLTAGICESIHAWNPEATQ